MRLNRKALLQIDLPLLFAVLGLASMGLIAVSSAAGHAGNSGLFWRQAVFMGAGLAAFFLLMAFDYKFVVDWAFPFYGLVMALLIAVLFFGNEINGSRSWIRFGGVGFQPSELAKVALVLALAHSLSEIHENYLNRKQMALLVALTLVPTVLVVMQGDLGTALTFLPILLGTMVVAGLRIRFLIVAMLLVVCIAPVGWWTLKDYQKQRILVTFDPNLDPSGVGYQTRQSLIAIGSGGVTGKGIGEGLQSRLGFVPEIHSDFIFSLLAEELGTLGTAVVLGLYLLALMRMLRIAGGAKDRPGILVVTGVVSLLFFHVMVNVGMTLGIMPAIGIPLPLLSYGGSATLVTFIALGLVMSVYNRRFLYRDELFNSASPRLGQSSPWGTSR